MTSKTVVVYAMNVSTNCFHNYATHVKRIQMEIAIVRNVSKSIAHILHVKRRI